MFFLLLNDSGANQRSAEAGVHKSTPEFINLNMSWRVAGVNCFTKQEQQPD